MIPKDPEDININASQQGLLEIAEHFFRQKLRLQEQKGPKEEENKKDGV
ncbi:MAG: hypothetical protein ACOY40_14875 [Bacillota bacterium]